MMNVEQKPKNDIIIFFYFVFACTKAISKKYTEVKRFSDFSHKILIIWRKKTKKYKKSRFILNFILWLIDRIERLCLALQQISSKVQCMHCIRFFLYIFDNIHVEIILMIYKVFLLLLESFYENNNVIFGIFFSPLCGVCWKGKKYHELLLSFLSFECWLIRSGKLNFLVMTNSSALASWGNTIDI